jgi:shikimate dehydrogenase
VTLSGKTQVFTILAHPSAYVVAPMIYNHIFSHMGLDMVYIAHDVIPESLPSMVKSFAGWQNLKGFNVTIPHKESIVSHLTGLCAISSRIGVVNTVVRHEDGSLFGYNTDGLGAIGALGDVSGATCLVIGAGGAGRSIADALVNNGARHISILNRSLANARKLRDILGNDKVSLYEGEPLEDVTIVVQATPVSHEIPFGLELGRLKRQTRILETVMRPTVLSEAASRLGLNLIPGHAMLYYQTRKNFELFAGLDLPRQYLDDAFIAAGYSPS